MNRLKKLITTFMFAIIALQTSAFAQNNNLTVKFKQGTDENFVKVFNLMTETLINEKLDNNTYKLKILKEITPEVIENYNYLISTNSHVDNSFFYNKDTKAGDIVPGIVLVKFKKDTPISKIKDLNKKLKANSKILIESLNIYKITLPKDISVEYAIKEYSKHDIVVYAEPDRVLKIQNDNNINSSFNSGIMLKKDTSNKIKVNFRQGTEVIAMNLFNYIFNTNLIKYEDSSYILGLPENVEPLKAIKAYELCPYVMNISLIK